jgi:hypothetical protein
VTQPSYADVLAVLRDISGGYAKLTTGDPSGQWPGLVLVAVTVNATHGLDPQQAFRRGEPGHGWVRGRSAAYRTDEGKPAGLTDEAMGPAIAGEWTLAAVGVSVHLRQDPDNPGRLARWEYTERLLAAGETLREGERPALRQRITVMARSSKRVSLELGDRQPVIVYHVFWGADPSDPHAIRRLFARFVQFSEEHIMVPAVSRETRSTQGAAP